MSSKATIERGHQCTSDTELRCPLDSAVEMSNVFSIGYAGRHVRCILNEWSFLGEALEKGVGHLWLGVSYWSHGRVNISKKITWT